MPFIGNKPSAIPLTSADITDGIITSAKIVDGTIVNADINASAAIAGTKLTGAGKVLQVVTATDSTQRSTTSTSFVTASNTLSVSITPSSTSSKIYIVCSFSVYRNAGGHVKYTIFRGATNLGDSTEGMAAVFENQDQSESMCLSFLDSPNSTSSLTYQLYIKGFAGITDHFLNYSGATSSITAFEIGA